jgi:activator of HSP90 ATPase
MFTAKKQIGPWLTGNRRQWILGAALGSGGFFSGVAGSLTFREEELSHGAEAIHQEVDFKASPKRIYEVLLDAKEFQKVEMLSEATKAMDLAAKPAAINRQPGGEFSLFGAYIVGRQVELLLHQRIVQAWRTRNWSPGVYSIARFELTEQGSGTKLVFDHTGFPVGTGAHLAAGWKANYWQPLARYMDGE